MPSWANHFRIADKFMPMLNELDKEYFIIGNIAPDCGIQIRPHGIYNPPTGATHFTKDYEYSKKTDCNYNYIYETYVKDEKDIKRKSFFAGYYIHLFTDCYYAEKMFMPLEEKYGDFRYNEELSKTVKRERNNIDFIYLKKNKSKSYEMFKTFKGFEENYPSWYKNGEIPRQMKNIISFYENAEIKDITYKYLSKELFEQFVETVFNLLLSDIENKSLSL